MDLINIKKGILQRSFSWHRFIALRGLLLSKKCGQNHYDVLGLKETCSQEDIRAAFVAKSKELHPDKNSQNPNSHKSIVAVNEAYTVLSKKHTRDIYDHQLAQEKVRPLSSYHVETNAPRERVIFYDDSLYENRDKSKDDYHNRRPYYGIKGVKKLPNSYIAGGVILFMVVGAIFHYFLAKISASYALAHLDKRDKIASRNYREARERALANGSEKQLDWIRNFHKENEERSKTS